MKVMKPEKRTKNKLIAFFDELNLFNSLFSIVPIVL